MTSLSHLRPASTTDLDRLLEIHLRAFPDARGVPERLRNFRDNPFGPLSQLYVAERDGVLVGHAFLFEFALGCHGVLLPIAGIASVGIAPEARGLGVATELLQYLHQVARADGKLASLLFPFREGFYARLGYGKTSPSLHLACAPTALAQLRGSCKIRAATGEDRGALIALQEHLTKQSLGRVARSVATWDKLFADERRYVLVAERGGHPVGYATLQFEQEEAHAAVTLRVRDLIAADSDVERSLLGALGAQRDQVELVELEVPYDSHLPQVLLDLDAGRHGTEQWEHPVGKVTSGAMVRVLDFEALAKARPLTADGSIALHVAEEGATYTITQQASLRTVSKLQGRTPGVLSTNLAGASSLLLGGVAPTALLAAGFAEGDETEAARAHALLGRTPFFGCDPF